MSKLSIGTAKFDYDGYGLSSFNKDRDLEIFFKTCNKLDVNKFDTSPRYGESEKLIGKYLYSNKNNFISTKIDQINLKDSISTIDKHMNSSIENSLKNLGVEKINLCYLHENQLEIISNKDVLRSLRGLKENGLVKNIGASIYSIEELDYVISSRLYDWVQIPVNILDTSFYNYIIDKSSNINIAARSLFLQGNLINKNSILMKNYTELESLLNDISNISLDIGIDLADLMVSYINSLNRIDQIIIGTTSKKNLESIVESLDIRLDEVTLNKLHNISVNKKNWTNPRIWNSN